MQKLGSSFLVVALMLSTSLNLGAAQCRDNIASKAGQGLEAILKMGEEAYEKEKAKAVKLPEPNTTYDFIIVGAGPAGCVLANRLSENPNRTVLLVEAGGTENIVNEIPVLAANTQLTPQNWNYKSTPQKSACLGMRNNECALPRGKLLGGTSGINFMLYNRGNREDYDKIAADGNYGWSYDEVLPYFKRSEMADLEGLEDSMYHNQSGLLSVQFPKYRTGMAEAFVEGSEQRGHKRTDYNGESQLGTSYIQSTTLNGRRHTAAKAFIFPILEKRPNLKVLTFTTVTKVNIDPETKSAIGVNLNFRDRTVTVKAKKEVILSAGTFNSPQLLLLSGIGPKDALESVGIEQLVELPVGKMIYEHMSHFGPTFMTNSTGETLFADRITPIDLIKYEEGDPSTRVSTLGGGEALSFIKTSKSSYKGPDVEVVMLSASLASDYGTVLKEIANFRDEIYNKFFKKLVGVEHLNMVIMPFHPLSRGKLWLKNQDPFTQPIIEPNYFEKEEDVDVMLEGIREAIRIGETPAMKKINATLFAEKVPGCEQHVFGTDEYWKCSISVLSYTLHHQGGTCKMGTTSDPTAVVSPELKVHGVRKLRVVDVSILPNPIACHTNAPSFMIGEKAADMIKKEWYGDE